jgi:hypothetical protein
MTAPENTRERLAEALDGTGVTANTGQSAARRLAAEVRELRAERDAVIEAVRAIHSQDESVLAAGAWCPVDGDEAPCRTLRAMHDALAGLIGGDDA